MVQKRKKQQGSREEKVLGAGMGVPLVWVAGSTWCLGNNMVTFFQCCWWGVVRVGGVLARNLLTTAAIKWLLVNFFEAGQTVGFVACKFQNAKTETDIWNPLRLLLHTISIYTQSHNE
jgi:hypothetical protein